MNEERAILQQPDESEITRTGDDTKEINVCYDCEEVIDGEVVTCPDCGKSFHDTCMCVSPDIPSTLRCSDCQEKHCFELDVHTLDNEGRLVWAIYTTRYLISRCYLLEQVNNDIDMIVVNGQRIADLKMQFTKRVTDALHVVDNEMVSWLQECYTGYEDWG